jgi:hypothetical protein
MFFVWDSYTLSGSVFRYEFVAIIGEIIKRVFGVNNRVYQRCQRIIAPNAVSQQISGGRTGMVARHVEKMQQ